MWTTTSDRARQLRQGSYVDCSGDAVRIECARDMKLLRERLRASTEAASRFAIQLREGDHRIKNSLQLITGLVVMQAKHETSDVARDALNRAAARIMSVAHVHDALQLNASEADIDMGLALTTMCRSMETMAGDPGRIHVQVETPPEPVLVSVILAQPIMLIVNELTINALKHAFPDGRSGSVCVSLTCAGAVLHLCVSDDGVGLPDGYSDSQGFGMNLVRMAVRQISGKLTITSANGTCFTLDAPAAIG